MVSALVVLVLLVNLATFLAFGIDKLKAGRHAWRVPETTLLLLALLTGFPGAWLGARVFHHKTRKTSFLVPLVLVSIFNPLWLLLWLWL